MGRGHLTAALRPGGPSARAVRVPACPRPGLISGPGLPHPGSSWCSGPGVPALHVLTCARGSPMQIRALPPCRSCCPPLARRVVSPGSARAAYRPVRAPPRRVRPVLGMAELRPLHGALCARCQLLRTPVRTPVCPSSGSVELWLVAFVVCVPARPRPFGARAAPSVFRFRQVPVWRPRRARPGESGSGSGSRAWAPCRPVRVPAPPRPGLSARRASPPVGVPACSVPRPPRPGPSESRPGTGLVRPSPASEGMSPQVPALQAPALQALARPSLGTSKPRHVQACSGLRIRSRPRRPDDRTPPLPTAGSPP